MDPAIVQQIKISKPEHASASANAQISPSSSTEMETGALGQNTSGKPSHETESGDNAPRRRRTNSLRNVKNSTEVLRQRSLKAPAAQNRPGAASIIKEGKQFTVGNVGTGGFIYLKYEISGVCVEGTLDSFADNLATQTI